MPGLVAGIGAVALALGGVAFALAPSALADGTPVPGNPTGAQFIPGSTELKVEPVESGSHSDRTLTVDLTVRTLAADDPAHPGDQTGSPVIDFTATGGTVIAVKVCRDAKGHIGKCPPGATSTVSVPSEVPGGIGGPGGGAGSSSGGGLTALLPFTLMALGGGLFAGGLVLVLRSRRTHGQHMA
jgi:hypothetical protein